MDELMLNNKFDSQFTATSDPKSYSKAPSPWSVRGVSPETRSKVVKAAAHRRETIGEWVTNALTQAANEELGLCSHREPSADLQVGLSHGLKQNTRSPGNVVLALAERIESPEKRNDAIASLTILVEQLESPEQREKLLLAMMQIVAERAERSQERIANITRGLADIEVKLEVALSNNRMHIARNVRESVANTVGVVSSEQDEMLAVLKRAFKAKTR